MWLSKLNSKAILQSHKIQMVIPVRQYNALIGYYMVQGRVSQNIFTLFCVDEDSTMMAKNEMFAHKHDTMVPVQLIKLVLLSQSFDFVTLLML